MMTKQKEITVYAVSMILKAAFLAATWAGKARKRGLELIAKMPIDEKDKEIVFLSDQIYQLETQITIFQKQIHSSSSKLRYNLNERLFILWHMEYFQIPKRHVTKSFGIARSTLYRWLRQIDEEPNLTQQLVIRHQSLLLHWFGGFPKIISIGEEFGYPIS